MEKIMEPEMETVRIQWLTVILMPQSWRKTSNMQRKPSLNLNPKAQNSLKAFYYKVFGPKSLNIYVLRALGYTES